MKDNLSTVLGVHMEQEPGLFAIIKAPNDTMSLLSV